MAMSESLLDRLLEDYELYTQDPFDYGVRQHHTLRDRDRFASREDRVHKLATLLDFLGARQIANVLQLGRAPASLGSRLLLTGSRRCSQ